MTADEIRSRDFDDCDGEFWMREAAAQLAELNAGFAADRERQRMPFLKITPIGPEISGNLTREGVNDE